MRKEYEIYCLYAVTLSASLVFMSTGNLSLLSTTRIIQTWIQMTMLVTMTTIVTQAAWMV